MTRRDLIIIAALLNAALLIVLFGSALKTESSSDTSVSATPALSTPAVQEITPKQEKSSPAVASGDEVDQVLKEFALSMAQSAGSEKMSPEGALGALTAPAAEQSSIAQESPQIEEPSFAEELAKKYPAEIVSSAAALKKAAVPPPSTTGEGVQVRVKKGDYLDKIAKNNGVSVAEIMRVNHLATTNLKIGQMLTIPAKKTSSSSKMRPVAQGAAEYVVKEGDNPWTIAKKCGISTTELLRLNHLNDRSAKNLKPGDRLRIRG